MQVQDFFNAAAAAYRPPALSLENLWQEVGFTPNAAQRRAIEHTDGPLYLPAGPGSGKTRVLLWRTVNLIVFHGVAPEAIFLSTFTEKAALQLRMGLQALLGIVSNATGQPYDLSGMYIGTVHSLCQRLITDRRLSAGRRVRPPMLMDELAQHFHVANRRRWNEWVERVHEDEAEAHARLNGLLAGRASRSRFNAVSGVISFFNRLSEEALPPEVARARASDPDCGLLVELYEAYLASLAGDVPRTDFSLLQQQALVALSREPAAERVFRHVIIDEYQDTNTIQERLFFTLARGHRNLCVVGDDDQALYRFRGATVENFVQFPRRCQQHLDRQPTRIALATNYRSRRRIVSFYTRFIDQCDWQKDGDPSQHYRVVDKDIRAHSADNAPAVLYSAPAPPEAVCAEVAQLVRRLLDTGRVADPNQIAFLFPSLKSTQTGRMQAALEAVGLRVYAPRARRFLEVDEAVALFGLFVRIFGRPPRGEWARGDYGAFQDWLDQALSEADRLIAADPQLATFVSERQGDLQQAAADYQRLAATIRRQGWDLEDEYSVDRHKRRLAETAGISERTRRTLVSRYFDQIAARRAEEGNPFRLSFVINRAAGFDWNLLDLFYQLCGFDHFKAMFDLAERGEDEGPVCNLSLISQYLARFMEQYAPLVRPSQLLDNHEPFQRLFFLSYLYTLFRMGESEYEDANDPFPRGRIPFLTIHQSKGLEFPVVVLGNPRKSARGPRPIERLIQPLVEREDGEPLARMSEFDAMRMFYVALSRAENLLVIPYYKSQGNYIDQPFKDLEPEATRIADFDIATLPAASLQEQDQALVYSYTGDYMHYQRCPRQYMVFRKYGFAPSHSQTQFFGSLVHRTLEDLHQLLIARRGGEA